MDNPIYWEYRIETFGSFFSSPKDDELEADLDEWGAEGWEVFAAHHLEGSNKVRIIARRPLSAATLRRRL